MSRARFRCWRHCGFAPCCRGRQVKNPMSTQTLLLWLGPGKTFSGQMTIFYRPRNYYADPVQVSKSVKPVVLLPPLGLVGPINIQILTMVSMQTTIQESQTTFLSPYTFPYTFSSLSICAHCADKINKDNITERLLYRGGLSNKIMFFFNRRYFLLCFELFPHLKNVHILPDCFLTIS